VLKASDTGTFTNTATVSGVTPRGADAAPVSGSAVVTTRGSGVRAPHPRKPHRGKPPKRHARPAHPVHKRAQFTG
jgi:hypothetical protein